MNRGDVVLADWLYSDRTGSKLRPAVVVQADFLNALIDDTILVQITSTRHGIPGTEVELDPTVEAAAGLLTICYASCTNLMTVDPDFIDQRLGALSDAAMREIEECLKRVMALP
jgi:mRNA-degrading endonuclease toxin of MazEF toxin-antitoxin module